MPHPTPRSSPRSSPSPRRHAAPLAAGLLAALLAPALLTGCETTQRQEARGPEPLPTALAPDGTPMTILNTQDLGDGLIAQDLRIGDGPEVSKDDVLVVHTVGTYPPSGPRPGKVFYSTIDEGKPLVWPLARLIDGWKRGVPGMRVGGVRTLFVPWQLAYKAEGKPDPENPEDGIPPKADLYFTIELLDLNPPDFDRSTIPD